MNTADPYWQAERIEPANMPPFDPRPRVLCEKCSATLVERQAAYARETIDIGRGQTMSVPAKEMAPRMTLKVKGEPCQVCGDNSPRGTFAPAETSGWSRFGEHGGYQYLYEKHGRLWAGNVEEMTALRDAVRAAAPKQRKTKLQLVA